MGGRDDSVRRAKRFPSPSRLSRPRRQQGAAIAEGERPGPSEAADGIKIGGGLDVSGSKHPKRVSPEEVAQATVRVSKSCVPVAVPGIAFLSGGPSDATMLGFSTIPSKKTRASISR